MADNLATFMVRTVKLCWMKIYRYVLVPCNAHLLFESEESHVSVPVSSFFAAIAKESSRVFDACGMTGGRVMMRKPRDFRATTLSPKAIVPGTSTSTG